MVLIVVVRLLGGIILPFCQTRKGQVVFYGVVAVVGMAHLDFLMGVLMFLAPVIVVDQFLTRIDGEIYCEGRHQN